MDDELEAILARFEMRPEYEAGAGRWGTLTGKIVLCIAGRVVDSNSPAISKSVIGARLSRRVDERLFVDYVYHPLDPATGAPDKFRLELPTDALWADLVSAAYELKARASSKREILTVGVCRKLEALNVRRSSGVGLGVLPAQRPPVKDKCHRLCSILRIGMQAIPSGLTQAISRCVK